MLTLLSLPREILDHIASFLPRRPHGWERSLGTGFELALCCRDLVDVGLRAAYRSILIETYTERRWAGFCVAVSLRPAIAEWVIVLDVLWHDADLPPPGYPVLPLCETFRFASDEERQASLDVGLAFAAAVCPNVSVMHMARPRPDRGHEFPGEPMAPSSLRQLSLSLDYGRLEFGRRLGVCGSSLRCLRVFAPGSMSAIDLLKLGPACPLLERLEIRGDVCFPRGSERRVDRTIFPSLRTLMLSDSEGPRHFLNLSELPSLQTLKVEEHRADYGGDAFFLSLGVRDTGNVVARTASALRQSAHAFPALSDIGLVLRSRSDAFLDPLLALEEWTRRRGIAFDLRYEISSSSASSSTSSASSSSSAAGTPAEDSAA